MANEALLKALNNTLNDLRVKRDKVNESIENQQFFVDNSRHCLVGAEEAETFAKLELKELQDQLSALVTHVHGLATPPVAL